MLAQRSTELARLARLGWRPDTLGPLVEGVRFAGESAEIDYPEVGFRALGLDGGSGYWFDHRADEVIRALDAVTPARCVWDVGAGTGAMSIRLARVGREVVAVEPYAEGATAIARHGSCSVFCASLEQLRLPPASLQVVGLFDVIEHIRDPRQLMMEVHRVLEPGGVVAVTVPALRVLWSDADEVARHHHRYRRKELDDLMSSYGFECAMSRYLFASLVAPAALMRAFPYRLGHHRREDEVMTAVARQLRPHRVVDRTVRATLQLERAVASHLRLPVGLTVMGIYLRRSAVSPCGEPQP